ncbi:MAG: lysoplasmalogenase, partial [Comamonadaceae bacterium]
YYVADPRHRRRTPTRFDALLMGGLAFSLAGDTLLMFPGYFIPGLVAFLVAHLFYIALFRQGMPWFPNRRALAVTLGFGVAMYAFLFSALNPVLRLAVAAYVVVIALMAAQAIGRATLLRDKSSVAVAVGVAFFMASDALLATNKFAFPLPMAQFWVLGTYYAAQLLIVRNARVPAATVRRQTGAQPSTGATPAEPA